MFLKVKIFILLFLSTLSLNASILYDAQSVCIEGYYVENGNFYFLKSSDNSWYYTSNLNQVQTLFPNYIYDLNTSRCIPDMSTYFGLEPTQFNFLLAMSGSLIGLIVLIVSLKLVLGVGGNRT